MSEIHECKDRSDCVVLYGPLGLYLKPIARINITIHYPQLKNTALPAGGKSVSSWELMEKLKALVEPQQFITIKIVKNTLEFIRFEGDLETREDLKTIMARLEGKKIKMTVFKEPLKILVAEAKLQFPSKYDWDSFFRDSKHMNEMRPGERPDTIHLQNLPSKWFSTNKNAKNPQPSESLFKRVFEMFGEIRHIDIPVLDVYRSQMSSAFSGIKTFTFNQDPIFEAYVQYKDYMSFVKAMDGLRGMFLMNQEKDKLLVANVKINFDKSKHLTEESIKRRRLEREKLMQKDRALEIDKFKLEREHEAKAEEEAEKQRMLERKIAIEEERYMEARRKLESIRLIDYLMEQMKVEVEENGLSDSDNDNDKASSSSRSESIESGRGTPRKRCHNGSRSGSSEDEGHARNHRYKTDQRRNDNEKFTDGEKAREVEVPENEDEALDFYQRNSAKYYRNKGVPTAQTYYNDGDDKHYHPAYSRGGRPPPPPSSSYYRRDENRYSHRHGRENREYNQESGDASRHTIHLNPRFHPYYSRSSSSSSNQYYDSRKRYNNYQPGSTSRDSHGHGHHRGGGSYYRDRDHSERDLYDEEWKHAYDKYFRSLSKKDGREHDHGTGGDEKKDITEKKSAPVES